MLLSDNSIDINRILIILICEYIYENKPKLNLLSICKFFRTLKYTTAYYQDINIFADQLLSLKPFDNIISIKIIQNYRVMQPINYLCPKLEKLNIYDHSIVINTRLPQSLTKLKLSSISNTNLIFFELPPKLKCLILRDNLGNFSKYSTAKILNESIEHLGLYLHYNYDYDLIKRIIPKNIKYLEFNNWKFFDMLHLFPSLTKIKIVSGLCCADDYVIQQVKKIPDTITSVFYNCWDSSSEHFLNNIKKTVTALSVNYCCVPISKTVRKLKIRNFDSRTIISDAVQELHILTFVNMFDNKLHIEPNIKKLIINFKDKNYLAPNIHHLCKIIYKY